MRTKFDIPMATMVPLFEREGFLICFEAEHEVDSVGSHFRRCGWTEAQIRPLRKMEWFSAKVSAWKNGVELGTDYLGACCYETIGDFITTYNCEGGYFPQMVDAAIEEAKLNLHCLLPSFGAKTTLPGGVWGGVKTVGTPVPVGKVLRRRRAPAPVVAGEAPC